MSSPFSLVPNAPVIEAAALSEQCVHDKFLNKVNLTLGVYRNSDGKPTRLPVVKKIEIHMASNDALCKDYLPIIGKSSFSEPGIRLVLGENHPANFTKTAAGVQTIGGTGAFFLAVRFLYRILGFKTAYVSSPSWPSHRGILTQEGFIVKEYRYWDKDRLCLDFDGLFADLSNASEGSVIILHACAHNPTGMDLIKEQWIKVAAIMKERKHFPLFDIAYQGFASGDLNEDAWVIRMFLDEGFEIFAAQSFSKNFGLYNERVGNLIFVTKTAEMTSRTTAQLLVLARYVWSNPVHHGSHIVSTVLNDPKLTEEWKENLHEMSQRILKTRAEFHKKLIALGTPGKWDNIVKQRGMFSYTGLTKAQTDHLREKYHIYLTGDGRMNMCGLNVQNIDYVAQAFHDTIASSTTEGTSVGGMGDTKEATC